MPINVKSVLLTGAAFVTISSFGPQAEAATGHVSTTTETVGAATGTAGDAGEQFGAPNITVTGGAFTGGNGVVNGTAGAAGGDAGAGVNFNAESGTALINNGTALGGHGADGTANAAMTDGGAGGNGGTGVLNNVNNSSVTGTGAITGGAGGDGGTAGNSTGIYFGGNGGAGGDGIALSGTNAVMNDTGVVTGGAGGTGGISSQYGTAGNGGVGGNAYNFSNSGAQLTLTGNVFGGAGGNGGASFGYNGAAGNGGNGGDGVLISGTGASVIVQSSSTVQGGAGGTAGSTNTGFSTPSDGSRQYAIDITGAGATVVNHGHITGLDAFGLGLGASTASVSNDGTISSTTGTAFDNQSGTLGLLTNTGTFTTVDGAALATEGEVTTLNNTNTISATAGGSGIVLNGGTIDTLTNGAGGTISSVGGNALSLSFSNNGSLLTTLNNNTGSSLITTVDGNAINLNNSTLTTLNNNGGTIEATGGGNGVALTNGTLTTLNNLGGTISATTGSAIGLVTYNGSNFGQLNNAGGIIQATDGFGIYVYSYNGYGSPIDTIDNTGGTIEATGNGTAILTSGATGSLINGTNVNPSGLITAAGTGDTITVQSSTITQLSNASTISNTGSGIALDINQGAAITTLTNIGTISATSGIAVDNQGLINYLINQGGTIEATSGIAVLSNSFSDGNGNGGYNNGGGQIDNSNGTILATTGTALEIDQPLSSSLTNAGGLITSASTGDGTLHIGGDIGGFQINGGTISNTSALNTAVAVNITAGQTTPGDSIVFKNIDIVSDGAAANSGDGIAVAISAGTTPIDIELQGVTNVRGRIVDDPAASDSVTLSTSAAITGDIAFSGGDDTLNFNGGSIAGDIGFGAGANTFNANGAFTTNGTISAASGYDWNLNVNNGGAFTVASNQDLGSLGGGATGGGAIDVLTGGALNVTGGNLTTGGLFTNHGTTTIGQTRTLTAGSFDGSASGTLVYIAGNSGSTLLTGHIDSGADAANLANQTVHINYLGGMNLTPASRSLIATGTGAATAPTAALIDSPYVYDFEIVHGTNDLNNLYLQLVRVIAPTTAAADDNNRGAAAALTGPDIDSSDTQIAAIQDNLNNAPTRDAYNNVLAATLPTIDNGAPMAAAGFTGQVFDVADSQLAMVNTGDATGVAAGDKAYGLHPWVQAFGQHANQDDRNGADGYSANTFGGAVGLDTRDIGTDFLGDNNVLGVSFAYGHSFVNSSDANATDTRVDTYQGTLYGNHTFGRTDYFVAGMAAFGYDRNHATRHDVGTIDGLDADSSYNSYQEATRAEFGKNFRLEGNFAGAVLTPIASADYVHYNAESYSEHGAGGADLHMNHQDENLLNLGIGGRAQWLLQTQSGLQLKPEVHGSYSYDVLNDDKIDATSSFAAGGGTFSTRGLNPSNSTFDVGAGVKLYNAANWDFTATYDFTVKTDYTANSGMLRAAYKF